MIGFLVSSFRFEPSKASAGIATIYSLAMVLPSLNCGLMAYSHSVFMMSLMPVWLSLLHCRPNLFLQMVSKASSMKIPPQRPPILSQHTWLSIIELYCAKRKSRTCTHDSFVQCDRVHITDFVADKILSHSTVNFEEF